MAILFYEGLPRAGKSYEAMVEMIIPWLKKGREVVAYVEGLNFEKIAEASELPVERVRELLFPLVRDDMQPVKEKRDSKTVEVDGPWLGKTRDNALHVFDEAQNWWGNRRRATDQLTQFVTEHGHRGITVLLMGQSLDDVSALWRRRVDQKFVFLKLSALGNDKRYSVTAWKGLGGGEFARVGTQLRKYNPKYFGTYASHTGADIDTETFSDKRANVLTSGGVRYAAMVALVCLVWGGWKAWGFFHPEPVKPDAVSSAKPQQGQQAGAGAVQQVTAGVAPPSPPKSPQERYFVDLSSKYRMRLAGVMRVKGRTTGIVEWIDGNTRVMERLTFETLGDLGVSVIVTGSAVRLAIGEWSELGTSWPLDEQVGRVTEAQQQAIRPAEAVSSTSGGMVVIGDGRAVKPPREGAEPVRDESRPRVRSDSPWYAGSRS